MTEKMNPTDLDELRQKTLTRIIELQEADDVDEARKEVLSLFADLLDSLGEHDIYDAYNDLPIV